MSSFDTPSELEAISTPEEVIDFYAPNKDTQKEWLSSLEEKKVYGHTDKFIAAIKTQLSEFFKSEDEIFIINISGGPSAGKSSLAKKIKKILKDNDYANSDLPVLILGQDLFHGTERGTSQRDRMSESPFGFSKYHNKILELRHFFQQVLDPSNKGKSFEIKKLYDRENGGVFSASESWQVPEGKFVLISEGTNAINLFRHFEGGLCGRVNGTSGSLKNINERYRVQNVFVMDDPGRQLQGVIARDCDRDNLTEKDRMNFRVHEFLSMLGPQIRNVALADIIIMDKEKQVKKRLTRNDGALKKHGNFLAELEDVLEKFEKSDIEQLIGSEISLEGLSGPPPELKEMRREVVLKVAQRVLDRAQAVVGNLQKGAENKKGRGFSKK